VIWNTPSTPGKSRLAVFHGQHDILASSVVKTEKVPVNEEPDEGQPGEDGVITVRICRARKVLSGSSCEGRRRAARRLPWMWAKEASQTGSGLQDKSLPVQI